MNWCRCATRGYPHVDPGCSQHGDLARTPATDSELRPCPEVAA